MTDRLQELLRQKALLQEHSAWLDREIAVEMTRSASATPSPPKDAGHPQADAAPAGGADAILDQYRSSSQSIHQEVKRGCLLYLAAAFAVLAAAVLAIYFFYRRG